jgi:hypothetical protein
MDRRAFLGAVLLAASGCVQDPGTDPSTEQTPQGTPSSPDNERFTVGATGAPPLGEPPNVTVANGAVTVLASVSVPNACHELTLNDASYDPAAETLTIDVGTNDTADSAVACSEELARSSFRYEGTVAGPVSTVRLRAPLADDDATVAVTPTSTDS